MPKIIKNVFKENLTYDKIYEAYLRARTNKGNRYEVLLFEEKLETNLVEIYNELKSGTYSIGEYRIFTIYEPKERLIKSLPFKDRVVHQWYVYEFLIPYVVPKFIYESYACIPGRGIHKASNKVSYYMKKCRIEYGDFYILKMDIRKYFYCINRRKLIEIIKKHFSDKLLLKLTYELIYDDDSEVSIAIGNYTSQYFANIYLNELDYYVKYELGIKYYLRYMDDFVLMVKDKETANDLFARISYFLNKELHLELNSNSRIYPSKMGVNFCGYRVFNYYKLIRKRSIIKIKKDVKRWNNSYDLKIDDVYRSYQSWVAYIKHANSYNLLCKYNFIIENIVIKYMFMTLPFLVVINIIIDVYFMDDKVDMFLDELIIIGS